MMMVLHRPLTAKALQRTKAGLTAVAGWVRRTERVTARNMAEKREKGGEQAKATS